MKHSILQRAVFLWKKKLKDKNYDVSALIPKSRAPIRRRQKTLYPEVVEYIKKIRWEIPRL
ncbi:MAG: hypothetical protein ABIN20_02600 [candidate division WOR-3 bacterium]